MKTTKKNAISEDHEFLMGSMSRTGPNAEESTVTHLKNVLKVNPQRGEVHYLMGNAYIKQALECFKKATDFNANDIDAHYMIGNIYDDLGDPWHAIQAFQAAIDIEPNYMEAYYKMSNAYKEICNFEKSAECFQKATEIESKLKDLYYNLGQSTNDQNNCAQNTPKKTKKNNFEEVKTLYEMGKVYKEQHNHTRAIDCFQKVLKINPLHADSYYHLGEVYKARNYDSTLPLLWFLKTIEINPKHAGAYFRLSGLNNGDETIQIKYLQKVIELDPKYISAYWDLIKGYKKQGNIEQTIEYYLKILEVNPENPEIRYKLAAVYKKQGDTDKALECYQKIVEVDDSYHARARAYLRIRNIYEEQGNHAMIKPTTKFAELINKHSWSEIEPIFVKLYPKWEKATLQYKQIYAELQRLTPIDRDMSIDVVTNWVCGCENHPQDWEDDPNYGIELTPWEEWLGMDIVETSLQHNTELEIISHCLWEMTFYGYSQTTITKMINVFVNERRSCIPNEENAE